MEKQELKLLESFLRNLSNAILPKMSEGIGKACFITGLADLEAAKLAGWEAGKLKSACDNFDKAAQYLPEEQQIEAYKNACICMILQGDVKLKNSYRKKIQMLVLSEKRKKYIRQNIWDFTGFVTLFRVIWSKITGCKYVSGQDRLDMAKLNLKLYQGQALAKLDEFERLYAEK